MAEIESGSPYERGRANAAVLLLRSFENGPASNLLSVREGV